MVNAQHFVLRGPHSSTEQIQSRAVMARRCLMRAAAGHAALSMLGLKAPVILRGDRDGPPSYELLAAQWPGTTVGIFPAGLL